LCLNRFEQDGGFPADIFLTLTQEGTLKVKPEAGILKQKNA